VTNRFSLEGKKVTSWIFVVKLILGYLTFWEEMLDENKRMTFLTWRKVLLRRSFRL
jgi:hypothetical protein